MALGDSYFGAYVNLVNNVCALGLLSSPNRFASSTLQHYYHSRDPRIICFGTHTSSRLSSLPIRSLCHSQTSRYTKGPCLLIEFFLLSLCLNILWLYRFGRFLLIQRDGKVSVSYHKTPLRKPSWFSYPLLTRGGRVAGSAVRQMEVEAHRLSAHLA